MAQYQRVKPGDLITADLINTIMEELQMVTAPGKVKVPKLFGYSLSQANSILTNPSVGLVPGVIIAADGQRIYPGNSEALEMPVLNQVPAPGELAASGSTVDIVIAARVSGGEPPVVSEHSVTDMDPKNSARANQEVKVIGENFETPYSNNTVFFDEVYPATPKLGSLTTKLIVDVPTDIPNLPRDVKVAVQAYGITKYLSRLYRIDPKSELPELKITGISPDPPAPFVREKGMLMITGTGFSDTAGENKITFIYTLNPALKLTVDGEDVAQLPDDEKRVFVTVPEFPGNMSPGDGLRYDITLHIGDNEEPFATSAIEIRPPLV